MEEQFMLISVKYFLIQKWILILVSTNYIINCNFLNNVAICNNICKNLFKFILIDGGGLFSQSSKLKKIFK